MRFIFTICLFLSVSAIIAQSEQETRNIATLCKVWGFLKYFHPEVSNGKLDWDKEFMKRVDEVKGLNGKEDISQYYLKWVESLGIVKKCKKCKVPENMNERWDHRSDILSDQNLFTIELLDKLVWIERNRILKNNFVVDRKESSVFTFENEKSYSDSINPSRPLRILALARFWNIYEFYFPYKYANSTPWDQVLVEMIPVFYQASSETQYNFALLELSAKVDDSHAGFTFHLKRKCYGDLWVPFRFLIIDKKMIVEDFHSDSLARLDDIRLGDVITEINGEKVEEIILSNSKYLAASNEPTRLRNFWNVLGNGFIDTLQIKFVREEKEMVKTIHRYPNYKFKSGSMYKKVLDTTKILEGNIGYVNMGVLEISKVEKLMKKFDSTEAIIIDIRNYPQGAMYEVANYLKCESHIFSNFALPDKNYPGQFDSGKPYSIGSKSKKCYSGKVILLVNESSQSHAEFTAMGLQTFPGVITIGSQTAGADGNSTAFTVPGGHKNHITCLGVYYPDGSETQRVGIKVDIEVKPTIQGIREGRDELLEKAIEVINKQ